MRKTYPPVGAAESAEAERTRQVMENVEEHQEMAAAAEHTEMEGAAEHADAAGAAEEKASAEREKSGPQIFQMTICLRDDWLHRGDALQDMDLHTYAGHIERSEKPVRGVDMQKTMQKQMFAFDAHYKFVARYMLTVFKKRRTDISVSQKIL